jgi:hypothetical protein
MEGDGGQVCPRYHSFKKPFVHPRNIASVRCDKHTLTCIHTHTHFSLDHSINQHPTLLDKIGIGWCSPYVRTIRSHTLPHVTLRIATLAATEFSSPSNTFSCCMPWFALPVVRGPAVSATQVVSLSHSLTHSLSLARSLSSSERHVEASGTYFSFRP